MSFPIYLYYLKKTSGSEINKEKIIIVKSNVFFSYVQDKFTVLLKLQREKGQASEIGSDMSENDEVRDG